MTSYETMLFRNDMKTMLYTVIVLIMILVSDTAESRHMVIYWWFVLLIVFILLGMQIIAGVRLRRERARLPEGIDLWKD